MPDPVQFKAGSVEQGLSNGRQLLADHPAAALTQAQTLLKVGPDPRVFRLAAAAHRRLGQHAEAEMAELAAIQQTMRLPRINLAAKAEFEGHSQEARERALALVEEEPDDLLAMTIAAEASTSLRLLADSERLLRTVLTKVPSYLRAAMALARCLMLQCRTGDAIAVLSKALERDRQNVDGHRFLAQLQVEARDYDGAANTYERLLATNDQLPDLWVSYGDMLRFLGRKTDSELAYRRALAASPGSGIAWWALTNLDPKRVADRDLEMLAGIVEREWERDEDPAPLHFALATVLDWRARHEEAFEHFKAGNDRKSTAQPYDPEILSDEVDKTRQLFTTGFYASHGGGGGPNDLTPIFIIGMPRSGSTLVERILGEHSGVEALGELPIIPRMVENLSALEGGIGKYRDVVAKLSRDEVRRLGETYLARAGEIQKTSKRHFTDKLHMNWRHAAFIRLILPNAKFIDVRRNALDCCWSNYKLLFTRGHPASNNLRHIASFYRDYMRMTEHLADVGPEAVLHVDYEKVVENAEHEARRIFAFLDLEFDPECLNFHQSQEPVATASSEQVRKPLNREGIGAWKPYEQWLGPLFDELGPLAER